MGFKIQFSNLTNPTQPVQKPKTVPIQNKPQMSDKPFVFQFNTKAQAPVKKEPQGPYDRKTYLKNYLQSLLRWTYDQNPEFAEYLGEDELVKWYLDMMIHPEWFNKEVKEDPFRTTADMIVYVRQFKESASTYQITMPIKCRMRGVE